MRLEDTIERTVWSATFAQAYLQERTQMVELGQDPDAPRGSKLCGIAAAARADAAIDALRARYST